MIPKFRAWHKETRNMLYFSGWSIDTIDSEGIIFYPEKTGMLLEGGKTDFILMQSTGLKDKNSKKIFEGDVLKHEDYDGFCVVEFMNGCFVAVEKNKYGNSILYDVEVIGNIHENPELLEAQA